MASRVAQITKQVKERIVYRTIAPNLALWPQTGELKTLVNEQCVVQSIKNLVRTWPTERYYHLDIGANMQRQLFDFADQFGADRLKAELVQTITNYEPRASQVAVSVTAFPQQNYFNVDILFVLTVTGQTVTIPTIALRAR
jgi:phage baseplate assembly protein W